MAGHYVKHPVRSRLPLTTPPLQWYKTPTSSLCLVVVSRTIVADTLEIQRHIRAVCGTGMGGHRHGYFPFVYWRGWAIAPGRIRPGIASGVDLSAAHDWDCLS